MKEAGAVTKFPCKGGCGNLRIRGLNGYCNDCSPNGGYGSIREQKESLKSFVIATVAWPVIAPVMAAGMIIKAFKKNRR